MVLTFKLRHNQEIYLFFRGLNVNAEQENNNDLSHVRLFLVALTDIAQLIVCHPKPYQPTILNFISHLVYSLFSIVCHLLAYLGSSQQHMMFIFPTLYINQQSAPSHGQGHMTKKWCG